MRIIRTLKVTCTSRFRLSPKDLITENGAVNSFYFRGIELTFGVITVHCTCARAEREYIADTLVSYNEQHRATRLSLSLSLSPVRLRQRTPTVKSEKETAGNASEIGREKRRSDEAGWSFIKRAQQLLLRQA